MGDGQCNLFYFLELVDLVLVAIPLLKGVIRAEWVAKVVSHTFPPKAGKKSDGVNSRRRRGKKSEGVLHFRRRREKKSGGVNLLQSGSV